MKFSWHVFAIKITSRKFWVALAGLAAAVMGYMGCGSNEVVQVTAIIGAFGTVIGYLIANGLSDSTSAADSSGTAATETASTESNTVASTGTTSNTDGGVS